MTPKQFQAERRKRNLTAAEFAELLGYGGNNNTKRKTIYDFEHGQKPIPPRVELALLKLEEKGK